MQHEVHGGKQRLGPTFNRPKRRSCPVECTNESGHLAIRGDQGLCSCCDGWSVHKGNSPRPWPLALTLGQLPLRVRHLGKLRGHWKPLAEDFQH